jgi:phospholipase A1/A2
MAVAGGHAACSQPHRMRHTRSFALLATGGLLLACGADPSNASSPESCASIADDRERLACYDKELRRPPSRWLSQLWDLDAVDKQGTFTLRPHHANYFLPARWSSRPNTTPSSPAPDRSVTTPLELDAVEAKYQLSFKLKILENIAPDNGDVWFGITQQSNWQVYNRSISAPFRETAYEPEAILSWRTDGGLLGWRWDLLALGYIHQSNGRAAPLSRSWNRAYAAFGLTRGSYTVIVRPWWQVPIGDADKDNPDLRDYLGHGDVRVIRLRGRHVYSALARYAGGGRGFIGLDWAFPVVGTLRGYLQVTHGHGETLIDYNHSQTTVGIGILLLPWQ